MIEIMRRIGTLILAPFALLFLFIGMIFITAASGLFWLVQR